MTRMFFALVALVGCCAGSARAETLPLLDGIPATYTPGTPFQFVVRVPALSDFTAFSVDLIFGTDIPDPPLFVSAQRAAVAPDGRYVFPTNGTFQWTTSFVGGSSEVVLTFADQTAAPVVTQPGLNDALAIVTVRPGLTLTGPLTIAIGSETAFEINAEINYPAPEPVSVAQVSGPANPVPAPASAALLGFGGLLLGTWHRLRRARTVC